jgi:hypothetical protein
MSLAKNTLFKAGFELTVSWHEVGGYQSGYATINSKLYVGTLIHTDTDRFYNAQISVPPETSSDQERQQLMATVSIHTSMLIASLTRGDREWRREGVQARTKIIMLQRCQGQRLSRSVKTNMHS